MSSQIFHGLVKEYVLGRSAYSLQTVAPQIKSLEGLEYYLREYLKIKITMKMKKKKKLIKYFRTTSQYFSSPSLLHSTPHNCLSFSILTSMIQLLKSHHRYSSIERI